MEKDRVRVMETGSEPETRPQKSNYRSSREGVGPASRHTAQSPDRLVVTSTYTRTEKQTNKQTKNSNEKIKLTK